MITRVSEDSILMPVSMLDKLIKVAAEQASKTTYDLIQSEKKNKSLDEKLSTRQVAKEESVSVGTVLNWIHIGVNRGKIKLKAITKGKRDFQIYRRDLVKFIKEKEEHYS